MKLAYSSNAYLNFSGRGDHRADRRRWATPGWNCWPTCRTPGRRGCWTSGSGRSANASTEHRLAIANVNAFMMNAVADPRQPYWHPSWIEPDPHYRAIRREHTLRARCGWPRSWARRRSRPSRAGRSAGPVVAGRRRRLLRRADALRRTGRAARGLAADRAGAGPADRDLRAVPGVRRADRLALGGAELRHRPRLLRGPGAAGLDRPDGPAHAALPHRGHRRHARATPTWSPAAGRSTFAAVLREIDRSGYDGWVTVELYPYIDNPDAAGREAKRFLENDSANRLNERWDDEPNDQEIRLAAARARRDPRLSRADAAAERVHGHGRRGDGLPVRPADRLAIGVPPPGISGAGRCWPLTSSLLYTAGMVLNDVFDLEVDRLSGPSGRCPRAASRWRGPARWAGVCLVLGVALGAGAGLFVGHLRPAWSLPCWPPHSALRRLAEAHAAGPAGDGRLPDAQRAARHERRRRAAGGRSGWWPAAIGIYVAGVTWFARREPQRSRSVASGLATAVMVLGIALLAWLPAIGPIASCPCCGRTTALVSARWHPGRADRLALRPGGDRSGPGGCGWRSRNACCRSSCSTPWPATPCRT